MMTSDTTDKREAFEACITASPYERDITRYPDDPDKVAWPGNYVDVQTNFAWCVWKDAVASQTLEAENMSLRLALDLYMAAAAAYHCSPHDIVIIRKYSEARAAAEKALDIDESDEEFAADETR